MSDETTALLIRARGLLERGWCRGVLALDAAGGAVDPTSKQAIAWCADGALIAAGLSDKGTRHPVIRRLEEAIRENFNSARSGIPFFNDCQKTVEPVLAAFDRAIVVGDR